MKRGVLAAALLVALPACAAIWGFEDGTLGIDGDLPRADSSLPPDSTVPVGDAGVADADVIDPNELSDAAPPGCSERVVEQNSYFVDTRTGEDTNACGSLNSPCRTFAALLGQIQPESPVQLRIYVGVGDYTESVMLPPELRGRGLRIDGRWFVRYDGQGRQWLPYCGSVATRLLGTEAAVLQVEGKGAAASPDAGDAGGSLLDDLTLSNLHLEGRPATPGESLYGLFAANAQLTLSDTTIVVARGGDGQAGPSGETGVVQGADCPPNPLIPDRAPGPPGDPGDDAPAQAPGTFTRAGYVATTAPPGGPGDPGSAGGPIAQCSLVVVPAKAGCGGTGGGPGGPGGLGGASVGLYLWSSHATLVRVALQTAGGGDGAAGGAGGPGGPGRDGQGGLGVLCPALGLVGSKGGPGGAGGAGAPAPGGPSYCTVAAGSGTAEGAELAACTFGSGGLGSATAAAGNSGALYTESDGGTEPTP